MVGHPARNFDAKGGKITVTDPDPGVPGSRSRAAHTEFLADPDDGGLQRPHIAVQVPAALTQMQDGIADKLTRTMIGNVPAPVRFDEFDTPAGVFGRRQEAIRRVGGLAVGDSRRMLQQKKGVWYLALLAQKHQLPLTLPGIAVRYRSFAEKIDDPQTSLPLTTCGGADLAEFGLYGRLNAQEHVFEGGKVSDRYG